MPVQKYTAREIVRKNAQKKATGLTRDQVSEETETARSMERQKGRGLDEPGRLDSLRLAEWAHTEWRRIGYVMAEEAMDVYAPEKDPKAAQWERQRLERVAAEKAAAGQDARGPATVEDLDTDGKLARLEMFVRETVLPRTHPHTTARRRVLEALGEAGGLCTARTRNSDGDVIVCTLDAGHYDPDDKPPFKDGKPGGWHKAGASIWNDSGAACIPHAAL
ncbi:hypothetical protein ACFV8T_39160 [Streptomyces sp. NPDC059832]|uniref:hypothetical protein n=1 Tax=Streptomyces sp. NPDC059832 TaxID=3346966 RepID=UPI003658A503